MNWYNTMKKISFPITDKGKTPYTDIGHYAPEKTRQTVIIWRIGSDYRLYQYKENIVPDQYGNEVLSHSDLATMKKFPFDYVSQGRYVPDKKIASMLIDPDAYGGWRNPNERKKEYITKRVISVLDRAFNNPEIVEFN